MGNEISFLRTKDTKIVNEKGEEIVLKGYGAGGWLNWEGFINAFPTVEGVFRSAARKILGKEKADFFCDRLIHYYLREEDMAYMRECGFNSLRVPFNYRHFEKDEEPFNYLDYGFDKLDELIIWAKKHDIYLILDLHAAQGWQNSTPPSDNPFKQSLLWTHRLFQDRVIGLWEEIARRYKDEPVIAGYELLNEPDAEDVGNINKFYFDCVKRIRKIDKRHIIFLEGSKWGKNVCDLEEPFDENLVYVNHFYLFHYLNEQQIKEASDEEISLATEMENRRNLDWTNKYNVPLWTGEFGIPVLTNEEKYTRLLHILDIQLQYLEKNRQSWNLWTYKDVGKMGLLWVDQKSKYIEKAQHYYNICEKLGIDNMESETVALLESFAGQISNMTDGIFTPPDKSEYVYWLRCNIGMTIGEYSLPTILECYKDMDENEIDLMMQSWKIENCKSDQRMINNLKKYCRNN